MNEATKVTPLHAWHVAHGGRMAPFAGYQMPIQYTTIVEEHEAVRNRAGLFDISHMGQLRFDGPRADQWLSRLLTRRVLDMKVGQVRYSLMCREDGGILDDVLVYCLESPGGTVYFLLVVNAGNRDKIVRWIGDHREGFEDVQFHDVTEQTAMIAVQGPLARSICKPLVPPGVQTLGNYRGCVTEHYGKPVIVSRTGYTGEDGLEWIVREEDAARIWENLLLAGREMPLQVAGLGARDTLRLEAAMPLYGHELSEEILPIEAGLDFALQIEGRQWIGRDAIVAAAAAGVRRRRIGLTLDGKRAARQDAAVLDESGKAVGVVTSGSFSPTLQKPIAMAYVDAKVADDPSAKYQVDIRGTVLAAVRTPLPFYHRVS
ncbi:MAG: glycine cleavage system aminomethyltransferase GcvT [Pirellulaceae bacterium]